MKTCLILTSHIEGSDFLKAIDPTEYDLLICADGGLQWAERLSWLGRVPTVLLGDYDSGHAPTDAERAEAADLVILPSVKDVTDSEAAIDLAVERGCAVIRVLGGLGGRLDHTMGNLGLLAKYVDDPRVEVLCFEDGRNRTVMKSPGTFRVERGRFDYFGLIAYGGAVEGLTMTGAKYPLTNHTLTPDTTLGVSNEIAKDAPFTQVTFTKGHLLVIESKD